MDQSLEAVTQGMAEERKEVFERVWRRVMHSGAEAEVPPVRPAAPAQPPALASAASLTAPEDYPRDTGVLGEACREYEGLLQSLIRDALADWQAYQALSRRAGGGPGRALAVLGAEARRRSKELGAVCFLISGVRYTPEVGSPPRGETYLGALRRLFRREQETAAVCLAGAETVADPCLRSLLLRHAEEAWGRAQRIRTLVEQAP